MTVVVKLLPDGVPPVGLETAVVVAVRVNLVFHALKRLVTFTEPRPVAASYWGPAAYATLLLKNVTPNVVPDAWL